MAFQLRLTSGGIESLKIFSNNGTLFMIHNGRVQNGSCDQRGYDTLSRKLELLFVEDKISFEEYRTANSNLYDLTRQKSA